MTCRFAALRRGNRHLMTHVLIAVDDTDTSVRAAGTAHRLFGDDARYTVINVSQHSPVIWGDDALRSGMVYPLALPGAGVIGAIPFTVQSSSVDPDQAANDVLDDAERRADVIARDAGIDTAEAIGDTGDVASAIIAAAHDHGADVIVVGTHDRGWFGRLFTGSVSSDLIRESDVPVLIAR